MMGSASLLLKLSHLPSRGRGMVASHHIQAGEVLLQETPLLIYLDAATTSSTLVCSHCARPSSSSSSSLSTQTTTTPSYSPCPSCATSFFCSPSCAMSAPTTTHNPFVCGALSRLGSLKSLDFDVQTQARFLVAAYNLAIVSPQSFDQLLVLEGEGIVDERVHVLHAFIEELVGAARLECPDLPSWSVDFVALLLAKDQRNTFGFSAAMPESGERQVRAYAIYAQASFINHNCLPNACRFDYMDKPEVGNTDIIIRSLHEISEGTEVCISYFPINWPLAERQRKLKEEYGFECTCERCQIEEKWSTEDRGDEHDHDHDHDIALKHADDHEDEDIMEDGDDDREEEEEAEESMGSDEEAQGSFPHAIFFVKYLCPDESCGGTLAPLPPSQDVTSATIMECNVCGQLRTEEEFLEEIEEYRSAS